MSKLEDYQLSDIAKLGKIFESDDARSIEQIVADDTNYEETTISDVGKITKQNTVDVTRSDGWSMIIKCLHGKVPRIGSTLRVYGSIGHPFYGYSIDGVLWHYETEFERFAKRMTMLAGFDRGNRERVKQAETDVDKWYAELRPPFSERVDVLRDKDPKFYLEGGSYETYPTLMAQRIHDWCKDRDGSIAEFKKLSHDEQSEIIHAGNPDKYGVSGFQFECAVGMANSVLTGDWKAGEYAKENSSTEN